MFQSWFRPTRAAAASLEPPASPAPIGMRFSSWISAPRVGPSSRCCSSRAARLIRFVPSVGSPGWSQLS